MGSMGAQAEVPTHLGGRWKQNTTISHQVLDFEALQETSCYWWKILIWWNSRSLSQTATTRRLHPSTSRHQIRQFKRSLRFGWSHLFQVPANQMSTAWVNTVKTCKLHGPTVARLCPVLPATALMISDGEFSPPSLPNGCPFTPWERGQEAGAWQELFRAKLQSVYCLLQRTTNICFFQLVIIWLHCFSYADTLVDLNRTILITWSWKNWDTNKFND